MRRKNGESGQSLVEFALVVPLLFLLLFGSIEFGRVFHAYHVVTSAAREGARAAAVGKSNTDIELKIEGAVSSLVSDPLKVTAKEPGSGGINTYEDHDPGKGEIYFTIEPFNILDRKNKTYNGNLREFVSIKAKGAVEIIVPLIRSFFSENPKIIRGEAEFRLE